MVITVRQLASEFRRGPLAIPTESCAHACLQFLFYGVNRGWFTAEWTGSRTGCHFKKAHLPGETKLKIMSDSPALSTLSSSEVLVHKMTCCPAVCCVLRCTTHCTPPLTSRSVFCCHHLLHCTYLVRYHCNWLSYAVFEASKDAMVC